MSSSLLAISGSRRIHSAGASGFRCCNKLTLNNIKSAALQKLPIPFNSTFDVGRLVASNAIDLHVVYEHLDVFLFWGILAFNGEASVHDRLDPGLAVADVQRLTERGQRNDVVRGGLRHDELILARRHFVRILESMRRGAQHQIVFIEPRTASGGERLPSHINHCFLPSSGLPTVVVLLPPLLRSGLPIYEVNPVIRVCPFDLPDMILDADKVDKRSGFDGEGGALAGLCCFLCFDSSSCWRISILFASKAANRSITSSLWIERNSSTKSLIANKTSPASLASSRISRSVKKIDIPTPRSTRDARCFSFERASNMSITLSPQKGGSDVRKQVTSHFVQRISMFSPNSLRWACNSGSF
ncbi:hypothetical protein PsorP6_008701 [Peronosclerospora sorghi]|uniref:Uncharacterized protein n=1 Tax=Peronosclerospora sorghi TaxID=230839 RepID=A0ACC0W0G3_9STRA|nr:hypothetical protein PsorP6_008701 [Peronosclerospora sorghi]